MEKVLLVYNPLSGHRSLPSKLDYIIQRFTEKDILVVPYRSSVYEEDKLICTLKQNSFSSIIISGGDGTINLVVNAMIKNDIILPIGLIPSGTCNDFARSLDIPNDLKKCIDIILAGHTDEIDVGEINGTRYFVNTCAGGVFVDVSFSTSTELKKNIGPLAYYLKALEKVPNIRATRLKVQTDTESIEQDFTLFLILNGRHAAGFNNIIEKADYSDGLMDIVLVKNILPIDIPPLLFKVLSNDFIYDRNVMWLRTRTCHIEGDSKIALTVDGEDGGKLPISVRFINKMLKVFMKPLPS